MVFSNTAFTFLCRNCLHIAKNIAYHTTEVKRMVMGNPKNLRVFNFANLLKPRKFDAREICVFYNNLHLLAALMNGIDMI